MNKILKLIGALLIVAAAVIGYFFDFSGDAVVNIATASFGLAFIVISTITDAKEKGKLNWVTYLLIALSILGGVLVCIGGVAESLIATIVGAALALVAVIVGLISANKK